MKKRTEARMRKPKISLQYSQKIALIIFLFTLIPLLALGSFYLVKTWNTKVAEIIDSNKTQLGIGVNAIHDLFKENTNKIVYVMSNTRLNGVLSTRHEEEIETVWTNYNVMNDVFSALEMGSSQKSVLVYSFNKLVYEGEYIRSGERLDGNLKTEILDAKENSVIWKYRKDSDGSRAKSEDLILYKKIMSIDNPLAIVEVRIPIANITAPLQFALPQEGFILYVTDDGADPANRIVVNSNQLKSEKISAVSEQYFKNNQSNGYYTIDLEFKENGHRVLLFLPKREVLANMKSFVIQAFIIILFLLIIIILVVKMVSKMITKRLSRLLKEMDVEGLINGEQLLPVDISGNDEFAKIASRFNKLILRITEYYRTLTEYEVEKKTLEMDLLQACINPHFLYNTLSALKWAYPDKKLGLVIDSMVKYYRIVLSKGDKIFTISREIDGLHEYMTIQKFAYKAEFTFTFEIDETVRDFLIVKNLLQPIVENALLHGINGMKSKGFIAIKGRLVDENIVFEISDNGLGMEEDKSRNILIGNLTNSYSGYGMKNVQKRIETYYGKGFGLSIASEINQGTTITVTIPAEKIL
ncbi:hypothetical protein EHS13_27615 [Paenibacillus psychroresistens]|uniref:histidine kinase n=1 Tax=Paenibacillus psychroresistens TaxID=1778678 RepID=A0A6B8RSV0_9BACL|nr:histidine kinase [Paenibacillus psychroresistens]QGQ98386.1 hypothetical protein EHS13_27615 [Paenibacillus psychroresistens]